MKNGFYWAIAIALVIILFMVFKMNKTMNLQNILLMKLADKQGIKSSDDKEEYLDEHAQELGGQLREAVENNYQETEQEKEEREEKELVEAMLEISGRIKNNEIISNHDAGYYKRNFEDMHENLQLADPFKIVSEAEGDNKANDDDSKEDGVFERKNLSREEKKSFVMSIFEFGIPKQLAEIAALIGKECGIKANKGNTSILMTDIISTKKLATFTQKSTGRIFYVLPSWMDGKKLKPEYLEKIK